MSVSMTHRWVASSVVVRFDNAPNTNIVGSGVQLGMRCRSPLCLVTVHLLQIAMPPSVGETLHHDHWKDQVTEVAATHRWYGVNAV